MRQKCNFNLIWVMLIMGIIPINRFEWDDSIKGLVVGEAIPDLPCCPPAMLHCGHVMPILGYLAKMRRNKDGDDGDNAPADGIFEVVETLKSEIISGLHLEIFLVKVL